MSEKLVSLVKINKKAITCLKIPNSFHCDDGGDQNKLSYLGLAPDQFIRFGQISQIIFHSLFLSPKYLKLF